MSIEPLLIRTLETPLAPVERPAIVRSPWGGHARTVGLYLVTLWAVVSLVFVLPRALPGDPLQSLNDPDSGTFVEDSRSDLVAAYYGLDKPLLVRAARILRSQVLTLRIRTYVRAATGFGARLVAPAARTTAFPTSPCSPSPS